MRKLILLFAIAASARAQISSFPPPSSGGALPVGTSTELQYRLNATTFGASDWIYNTIYGDIENFPTETAVLTSATEQLALNFYATVDPSGTLGPQYMAALQLG